MRKTVLITGGLGYLGGRIALHLNKQENITIRLGARHRSEHYPVWSKNLRIIKCDLEETKNLDALCEKVDVIIHLAALNAQDSSSAPERAKIVNVCGTERLLSAAIKAGVKRFIYVSTTHVYGSHLHGLIDERQEPKPNNPYAETHFQAEQIVANEQRIQGIILRLSNVVGPPSDPNANCWSLVSNALCRTVITSKTLTLRGSGEDLRDFISMADMLEIIMLILKAQPNKIVHKHYNIASGRTISMLSLATLIAKRAEFIFGQQPTVLYNNRAGSENHNRFLFSNTRIKALGHKRFQDITGELDSTLKFCHEVFAVK